MYINSITNMAQEFNAAHRKFHFSELSVIPGLLILLRTESSFGHVLVTDQNLLSSIMQTIPGNLESM